MKMIRLFAGMLFFFFASSIGWADTISTSSPQDELAASDQMLKPQYQTDQAAFGNMEQSDEWQFTAQIYLWASGVDTKLTNGSKVRLDFTEVLDNLNTGFLGTLAATRGKWGFLGDLIYLDLRFDKSLPFRRELETKLVAKVSNIGVSYMFMDKPRFTMNAMIGARYLDLEADIKLLSNNDTVKKNPSGTSWDGVVGLFGRYRLDDRWFLRYHLDAGTGAKTDYTWQGLVSAGYKQNNTSAVLGYRVIDWHFDDHDVADRITFSGPFIGLQYTF